MRVRQVEARSNPDTPTKNRGIDRQSHGRSHVKRQADTQESLAKEQTTPSSGTTASTSTSTGSSSSPTSTLTSTPKGTATTSSSSLSSSAQLSTLLSSTTAISSAPSITSSLLIDSTLPTSSAINGTSIVPSTFLSAATAGNSTFLALPTGPAIIPASSADASDLPTAPLAPVADTSSDDGLSSGAKAGIAVGTIAGACILVLIVFAMLRMRRGSSISAAFMLPRRRKDSWSSHGVPHLNSDGETVISGSNSSIKRKSRIMVLTNALPDHLTFTSPKTTAQRPGTAASQRPLVFGAQALGQINEEPESPTVDITRPPNVLHIVNGAPVSLPSTPGPGTPAHPSTPIPTLTRTTPSPVPEPLNLAPRTPSDMQRSPAGSPLPQYLKDAAFSSSAPKSSRFSWTNSGAPKTPLDLSRLSAADSTTSSVPRYRTVDSWCGAQATRLGDRPVQDHLRQEIEAELQESSERIRPMALNSFANNLRKKSLGGPVSPLAPDAGPYPSIPTPVSPIKEDSNVSFDAPPAEMLQSFPNPQLDKVKRQEKCQTLLSDITVFKAHPGTLVTFPNENRVPSLILDQGVSTSALH